jgi:hypothetical protein
VLPAVYLRMNNPVTNGKELSTTVDEECAGKLKM